MPSELRHSRLSCLSVAAATGIRRWFPQPGFKRRILLLATLAILTGGAAACRELTAPVTGTQPGLILARGRVTDAHNNSLWRCGVEINVNSDNPQGYEYFSVRVETDQEGYFEVWIPEAPVRIVMRPGQNSPLPRAEFRDHRFEKGRISRFILPEQSVVGRIRFSHPEVYDFDARLEFHSRVTRPDGIYDWVTYRALSGEGGLFEVFVTPGVKYLVSYANDFAGSQIYYAWPDSVSVVPGDSLLLDLELTTYQLELTLGGGPLPLSDEPSLRVLTELRSNSSTNVNPVGDGVTTRFELFALPGSRVIEITNNYGEGFFVPARLIVDPLQGGESLHYELGRYRVGFEVRDEQGLRIHQAGLRVYSEFGFDYANLDTDLGGRCELHLNPLFHRAHVSAVGYFELERYFQVEGDSTIVLTLQRDSS